MATKKTTKKEASLSVDLVASLAIRRQRTPASWETDAGLHKRRFTRALEAIDQTALVLGQDIASVLADRVDDLATYHHEFKSSMQRVFLRVLRAASASQDPVLIFNDAIPGFTLLLFKRDLDAGAWSVDVSSVTPASGPESEAASHLIKVFVERTGDRVVTIENDDALFIFFPASDVKKNLKELGFYLTDS